MAKKELGVCELEEPLVCQQFPRPEPGRKGEAKRNAKMLGVENAQIHLVTWERLDFTRFHTISLEVFFTGHHSPRSFGNE